MERTISIITFIKLITIKATKSIKASVITGSGTVLYRWVNGKIVVTAVNNHIQLHQFAFESSTVILAVNFCRKYSLTVSIMAFVSSFSLRYALRRNQKRLVMYR